MFAFKNTKQFVRGGLQDVFYYYLWGVTLHGLVFRYPQ